MNPGDVVRIPPNQKHWHGATATTAITHIAIQDEVNGKVVDWMEKVSDEQYGAKPVRAEAAVTDSVVTALLPVKRPLRTWHSMRAGRTQ